MPYTSDKPRLAESSEQLRARIPGWGADLDPADRPSVPHHRFEPAPTVHWDLPDQQPEKQPRERSIEHTRLTPVFGTAAPLKGLSGAIRRRAYAQYSEGQTAHWLLLMAGDRIDTLENAVQSFVSLRPDNPLTQTGVLGEFKAHPIRSRFGQGGADLKHLWLDPLLIGAPWVAAATAVAGATRAVSGRFRRRRGHVRRFPGTRGWRP